MKTTIIVAAVISVMSLSGCATSRNRPAEAGSKVAAASLTACAANLTTVDELVGHEFFIEDHWAGQEVAFKRHEAKIIAIWRILGSGVPVFSERSCPVEIRSTKQCVFFLDQNGKRTEVKISLSDDAEPKAYLDGIRIYIVEKKAQQTRCSEPGDGALVCIRGSMAPGH